MEVQRESGETYFKFEVPQFLIDIFSRRAKGTKESAVWEGLEFYQVAEITDSPEYKNLLSQYGLFDNYGSAMVDDSGRFNIAFLRTVGGRGKIRLNRDVPFAQVASQVRNITKFLKAYYEGYLSDYKVTGSVTIEL